MQSKKGMAKKKDAKTLSLIITLVVFILLCIPCDYKSVGVYHGANLWTRFTYHFFHAGIIHAALNVWCFLSVVFLYHISKARMLCAYLAASSIPVFLLADTPTVGISGMVFFLFATISFEVQRKLYYQSWMMAYIILGFLMPGTSAWVHFYCYACGFILALINRK